MFYLLGAKGHLCVTLRKCSCQIKRGGASGSGGKCSKVHASLSVKIAGKMNAC